MDQVNPYQAPSYDPGQTAAMEGGLLWRDGDRLVVHHQAVLPPVCVLTNEKSARLIKRTFYYHHPTVYLALLLNVLIFVVLALVLRKRRIMEVPLSSEALAKRRTGLFSCWIVALICIPGFIGCIFSAANSDEDALIGISVLGIMLFLLTFLITIVIGSRYASVLRVKKIGDKLTWFKGACPQYLDHLPNLPLNFR